MDPEELDDLIASHAEELTDEELDAITKVSEEEEEEEEEEEDSDIRGGQCRGPIKWSSAEVRCCGTRGQLLIGCKMPMRSWSVTSSSRGGWMM